MAERRAKFREIFETRTDKTLFLIGRRTVRYGEIMAVIDAAMGAGVDEGRHRHRRHAREAAGRRTVRAGIGARH